MRGLLLTAVIAVAVVAALAAQAQTPYVVKPYQIAPEDAPTHLALTAKSEPGEPMTITGRVSDETGPLKGASVYIYQTDAAGFYHPDDQDAFDAKARLRGFMRTDGKGRYGYDTVRPGSYPNVAIPAHVHYIITGPGYKSVTFEILFENDPTLTADYLALAAEPSSWVRMISLKRDPAGVWQGVKDVVLEHSD